MIIASIPAAESLRNNKIYLNLPINNSQQFSQENWTEIQKLLSSGYQVEDKFGRSFSINGDTALIGYCYEHKHGRSFSTVYVFTRNDNTWIEQTKLTPSEVIDEGWFGYSVSLSGDTALIGAIFGNEYKGAAYVFTRNGDTWKKQAKLTASDGEFLDCFGYSVSLSGDTALIGTFQPYGEKIGEVYVFIRKDNTWTQQAKLTASDGVIGDSFGCSVSLSGNTALIGSELDSDSKSNSWGSAYVFTRMGNLWTQQAEFNGPGSEFFGCSVSLSGDTALIGARGFSDNNKGAAYVFTRNGDTWTEQAKLLASDGAGHDGFGYSVSLSGDTALIGASGDDDIGLSSGSAYVFTRNGDNWTEQAKLLASDGAGNNLFGNSVSLSGDTAFIGAFDPNQNNKGSVYVFIKNNLPEKPIITGNSSGKLDIDYEYKFMSTDPDGDNISYCIDWGDNSSEVCIGPYSSGIEASATHAWSEQGDFTIKAKAKDIYGTESDWTMFKVSMSKNKVNNHLNSLLDRLLNYLSFISFGGSEI